MATGFGFRLRKAAEPGETVKCIHLAGDSVLLGKGDAVKLVTGSTSIGNGPIVQAVARADSGDRVFGVVVGVSQIEVVSGLNLDRTYCPASTAMYVDVKPVRTSDEFEIQEDAVGGAVASTSVGNNINMVVADASTTTGMSGTMADSSTAATTNTLDLCIRGFSQRVGNVPGDSAGAVLVVSFNKVASVDQATGV